MASSLTRNGQYHQIVAKCGAGRYNEIEAGGVMVLEQELAAYRRLLPSLLTDEGKFALLKGDALIGVFGTYEDALAEGYKQFKLEPFLVQQIRAIEQVHFITRLVDRSCRT